MERTRLDTYSKSDNAFSMAVLSDLHLSEFSNTSQEAVLRWAVDTLNQCNFDVIVFNGDMTQRGCANQVHHFNSIVAGLDIPLIRVPGNTDRRTEIGESDRSLLFSENRSFVLGSCGVFLFDSSHGRIEMGDRERYLELTRNANLTSIALVNHYPFDLLDKNSQEWLCVVSQDSRVSLAVVGHNHEDSVDFFGSLEVHRIRGLDPDTARGGDPSVACFFLDKGKWTREALEFEEGRVSLWETDEKQELERALGFSCMNQTLDGISWAIENNVEAVEIRGPSALQENFDELNELVKAWRSQVEGAYLSVHLPDLFWDSKIGVKNCDLWNDSIELALELEAQAMTIHPPRVSVADLCDHGEIKNEFLEFKISTLRPAINSSMILGIENLHTNASEEYDSSRGFGYTPQEIRMWIDLLRNTSCYQKWGFHFDVGHAFNNRPLSNEFSLNAWCSLLGREATGLHIHQIAFEGGKFRNHYPLYGWRKGLISYTGILWSWRNGFLNHVPMFVEIRDSEPWKSLKALRYEIGATRREREAG
ncbi:MAG: metallophosphoesterase [Verrucomicrobiota bacterium]